MDANSTDRTTNMRRHARELRERAQQEAADGRRGDAFFTTMAACGWEDTAQEAREQS